MSFTLPDLPYAKDALAPAMSRETLEYHYGKHHATYVNKLNDLVAGTDYASQSMEDIIAASTGPVFNNAAQVWNHTFFWQCLSPVGGGEPPETLKAVIEENWASVDAFKTEFTQQAINNFGSGWTWLALNSAGELLMLTPLMPIHRLPMRASSLYLPWMSGSMLIILITAMPGRPIWMPSGNWLTGTLR